MSLRDVIYVLPLKAGVGKVLLAGQIRPAEAFRPARGVVFKFNNHII